MGPEYPPPPRPIPESGPDFSESGPGGQARPLGLPGHPLPGPFNFFPNKSPWKAGENLARLADGPDLHAYYSPHPLPSRAVKLLKNPCVSAYGLRWSEPFFFAPYRSKWRTKTPLFSPNGLWEWPRRMSAPYRVNRPGGRWKRTWPAVLLALYTTLSCFVFRPHRAPPGRVVSSGAVGRLCSSRAT